MRPRFKRSSIYHAAPEPHFSFMARSEVLQNKLSRGNITPEEMEELASFRAKHSSKKGDEYYITILGRKKRVSKAEYLEYCRVFNHV